jgi:hypothetical protein
MLHPSKCEHSIYWPATDKINPYCPLCNPKYGLDSRATPAKKPRKRKSSTDNGLDSDNKLPEAA